MVSGTGNKKAFWLKHSQWRTQHAGVNLHLIGSHWRLICDRKCFLLCSLLFSTKREQSAWTIFMFMNWQVGQVKGLGADGEQSEAKWAGQ